MTPYVKTLFRFANNKSASNKGRTSNKLPNLVSYEGEIYWQRKRVIHCSLAMIFAIFAFIATSVILFIFLSGTLSRFLIAEHKIFSDIQVLYLFHIQFGVAATFVLWLMRIIYRVMFAQMYLWADAAERVTAVRTYYKLINTGFTTSEKQILLEVIFRCSSAGLQAKDNPSPSILKIITKEDS